MLFIILTIVLSLYIIHYRKRMRAKLEGAETIEIHYPDGSFTYITEKDLM